MKQFGLFFILILFIGFVSAGTSVRYDIIEEKVLVTLEFDGVGDIEYKLPYDARTVESNLDYIIHNNIFRVEQANGLELSYISNSFIEETKDNYFFILKNQFDKPVKMELILPEGGVLEENKLIFPDPDKISSDGRRIILEWDELSSEELLVSYEVVKDTSNNIMWILIVLIIISIVVYFYQFRRVKIKLRKLKKKKKVSRKTMRNQRKKILTTNLFGEEKKIVEYLLSRKKKESWTKEIVRDLGISKVRLSRRLRNLEQKGLIEKIPFGNENRVRLLRKR